MNSATETKHKRRQTPAGADPSFVSSLSSLPSELLEWYAEHGRSLPWRTDPPDPYRVLVSEFMCQQTQIDTVLPYFERWIERFPTVADLADASETDVLLIWQGLGYYRRATSLLEVARIIARSGWPRGREAWRKLPGVGAYTAGALASILDGERTPAVDGNVIRLYSRICDDASPRTALVRKANLWAQALHVCVSPGQLNQALMEFGATVCRPSNPECRKCVLQRDCQSFKAGNQALRPQPKATQAVQVIEMNCAIWQRNGSIALRKARAGEWWAGLWRLPDTSQTTGDPAFVHTHVVTHHRVNLSVWITEADGDVTFFELDRLPPLPAPHLRVIQAVTGR